MKKSFTLVFFLLVFSKTCLLSQQAQQAAQYSLYNFNRYAINPAYAGLDNSLSVTGVFRSQWTGLEGSPTTQGINLHMPLYFLRGGFGLSLENEVLGAEVNTSMMVAYNYWIELSKKSILTIGLSGGLIQKTIDGTKLRAPGGTYNEPLVFTHNDNFILETKESAQAPTAGIGIYFQTPKLEAGLYINNLLGSSFTINANQPVDIQLNRNYFFTLAGNLDIGRNLVLRPSLLVKSDEIQFQTDISATVQYNGNIFGGLSLRGYNSDSIDSIVLMGGFKLSEKLTLAYAYDLTLSVLNTVSNGSHEIMLNYNLNKIIGGGTLPKVIYNPRFL